MLDGYLSTTPTDILKNPCIVMVGATKLGVTRGGCSWESGQEIENTDFDGKQAPAKGLDRVYHGEPKIAGVLLDMGEAASGNQIVKLLVAASAASAGSPNVTTVTPADGGDFVSTYQADVRLIADRGIGSGTKRYAAVLLPWALFNTWSLRGGDTRKEVELPFEIIGRIDPASGLAKAAYKIEYREALPS